MTQEEKVEFKYVLINSIEVAQKKLTTLEDLTKPIAPENAIGRVSRMDAINNKSVNEAAIRKLKQKLIKLNHNLEALENDNFGQCARCGNEIPHARLLLIPETNRCTSCANL